MTLNRPQSVATVLQRYMEVWFSKDLHGRPVVKAKEAEVAPA